MQLTVDTNVFLVILQKFTIGHLHGQKGLVSTSGNLEIPFWNETIGVNVCSWKSRNVLMKSRTFVVFECF